MKNNPKFDRRQFLKASAQFGALVSLSATGLDQGMGLESGSPSAQKSIIDQVRAGEPLNGIHVLDVHGHIQETPGDRIWPRGLDTLLEDMDRCGINTLIFSHLSALLALSPVDLKAGHERSADAVHKHPARFKAYLLFNPHLLEASIAEMGRAMKPDSPFVGFKLHGAVHQYPATGANYQPLFKFAHTHSLPVLFHVAGRDTVRNIADIADKYPNMRLILAHLWPGEEQIAWLLKDRPNLFVDTSGSEIGYRQLERIITSVGAEKILFGSDATYLNTGAQIAKVAFAKVREEEKRQIFGINAERVFGKKLPRLATLS